MLRHHAEIVPTRTKVSGATDHAPIDAAIAAEEEMRRTEDRASRSFATPL